MRSFNGSHGNVAILQPLLSNIKHSIISRQSRDDGTDVPQPLSLSNDLKIIPFQKLMRNAEHGPVGLEHSVLSIAL